MDVKEFFYNGGMVSCKDRTESDVVIQIAEDAGFRNDGGHDPDGLFHVVCVHSDSVWLSFYHVDSPQARRGTPFAEWMAQYVHAAKPTPVEDLI